MPVQIELTENEAKAVTETLNRAYDNIPRADTKRWVDRVTSRIEKALRKGAG